MAVRVRTRNYTRARKGQTAAAYVVGADLVAASLNAAAEGVDDEIRSGGRRVARAIYDRQRELVPIGPDRSQGPGGFTRESIEWTESDEQDVYFEIGPTHFIARFLEFGTRKMSPRPFVWPSATFYDDEWVRVVKQAGGDV